MSIGERKNNDIILNNKDKNKIENRLDALKQ